MSPSINSNFELLAKVSRFFRLPVERLSNTRTFSTSGKETKCSVRLDPIKPAPPVIKMRIILLTFFFYSFCSSSSYPAIQTISQGHQQVAFPLQNILTHDYGH